MIKWLFIILAVVVVGLLSVAIWVTQTEKSQHAKNSLRLQNAEPRITLDAKTAVVVFSRSGNTGVLADHIAQKHNAELFEITATDYELGIPGWIAALNDARNKVATITPSNINLEKYQTIYLGSPIWLYSPAPPIWQFAKNNDFSGKNVVLFNTFNSKFEQHFIDDFEKLIRANGAIAFSHIYVKRGRMGSQISTDQLLEQVDAQLETMN